MLLPEFQSILVSANVSLKKEQRCIFKCCTDPKYREYAEESRRRKGKGYAERKIIICLAVVE